MLQSTVLGVLLLARNGDRSEFYQDPQNYAPSFTESTPLGAVESFQLGSYLKSTYLDSSSPLHILDMPLDPSHPIPSNRVNVHAKAGGEGAAIFDSSIALLQGLFPPTPLNRIDLANGSTIVAPLGGYQYVPVEMAEGGDHVLEPWTNCKAFKKHVSTVYSSEEFKQVAKDAQHFFGSVHDYMFGRPTTLEEMWNVYDYLHTQLIHNQSFAYRLPPTLIEQARGFVNYKEDAIFSDKEIDGIGNIAGRTILSPIVKALERIAFDDDPLRILLVSTSYQPFISLLRMLEASDPDGRPIGIPNYAAALSLELLRGPGPEFRDFVRLKFKNGTDDEALRTLYMFGHPEAEMPVTEFIYRLEHHALPVDKWSSTCSTSWFPFGVSGVATGAGVGLTLLRRVLLALATFGLAGFGTYYYRKRVGARRAGALHEEETCGGVMFVDEKSRLLPM